VGSLIIRYSIYHKISVNVMQVAILQADLLHRPNETKHIVTRVLLMSNPVKGFFYFVSGISLIFKPGIFRYAIWPLLINIGLFVGLVVVAYDQFQELLAWSLSYLPVWLDWLRYLLWPLFAISVALIFFFTFTVLANLIAVPFNGPLAMAVERYLGAQPDAQPSSPLLRSLAKSLSSEIHKASYFIIRVIPLLILFVIPGLNLFAPFLWGLFSAWMLSIEYSDYPMGNHELGFKQQRQILKQQRLMSLGFGGAVTLAFLIPGLNLLVMPAAVAGASKMWVQSLSEAHTR